MENFSEKHFGKLIQRTLQAGVFLSLFFFFLGFVVRFSSPLPGGGDGFLRTGVLLLALTPAARVAMLVYGYCRTREYHFALAAFTALGLLLVSALI